MFCFNDDIFFVILCEHYIHWIKKISFYGAIFNKTANDPIYILLPNIYIIGL